MGESGDVNSTVLVSPLSDRDITVIATGVAVLIRASVTVLNTAELVAGVVPVVCLMLTGVGDGAVVSVSASSPSSCCCCWSSVVTDAEGVVTGCKHRVSVVAESVQHFIQ